ncbi:hypothetical protein HDU98_008209 [Podochytrium sp. JEL0797]|nr:hypothetical protein HDU98_008209 [Podochytrium sp. JEL0797]
MFRFLKGAKAAPPAEIRSNSEEPQPAQYQPLQRSASLLPKPPSQSPSQSPGLSGYSPSQSSQFPSQSAPFPSQSSQFPSQSSQNGRFQPIVQNSSASPRSPFNMPQPQQQQRPPTSPHQQQQHQPPQQPDTILPIAALLFHFSPLIAPHLPPTHNNAPPTQDEIVSATVKYLTLVQMPPREFSISRHPVQGFVARISPKGIKLLERGIVLKKEEKAVLVFQKCWRRVLARRVVAKMREEKAAASAAAAAANARAVAARPPTAPSNGPVNAAAAADSWTESTDKPLQDATSKLERRKSKVNAFKAHLAKVSSAYEEIINTTTPTSTTPSSPSPSEIEFMRLMNSDETFRLSLNLRAMHKLEKPVSLLAAQQNYEAQGGVPGRSPAQMYHDYSPRVVDWIAHVLQLHPAPTTTDLVTLLRPADVLCHLAIQMFPHVQCRLLNKGAEFTIHKAVFFLELCKTVGVKPGMLFSLKDLFLGGVEEDPTRKCGLTVLRTVCALERQARRRGWEGPVMVLKVERGSVPGMNGRVEETAAASVSNATVPAAAAADTTDVLTLSSLTKRGSKIQGRPSTRPASGIIGEATVSSKESRRKSALSSRSSQESMRRSTQLLQLQQHQQQSYVTSLPSHFKSLPRDEKVALLVALPVAEARESLRILYVAQNEQFEYEDLMAVVWEKEHAETARLEEHEKRVQAAVQVREALGRRNEAIFELLKEEEIHLQNLTLLSTYLTTTTTYRLRLAKRRSRGLPTLIHLSPTQTLDIFHPLPTESFVSTTLRVSSQTETLVLLDRVLQDLVAAHTALVQDLGYLLQVQEEREVAVVPVGDVVVRFAGEVAGGLGTWGVVGLAEESVLVETVVAVEAAAGAGGGVVAGVGAEEEEQVAVSFRSGVVDSFVGSTPGVSGEVTREMAKWYLAEPLRRVQGYRSKLEHIVASSGIVGDARKALGVLLAGDGDVGVEWRKLVKEDRKLEVAAVKLGSVADAILARVNVAL